MATGNECAACGAAWVDGAYAHRERCRIGASVRRARDLTPAREALPKRGCLQLSGLDAALSGRRDNFFDALDDVIDFEAGLARIIGEPTTD